MDEIKSTVLGVCVSLLLIGFFLKLSPKGKLTKNMRILLSMVILLIIITPLSRGYSINLDAFELGTDKSIQHSESDYRNIVVENVVTMLKSDVEVHLKENNFGYYSVLIETSEKEGNAELEKIVVYIKSGYDPTKIQKSVTDKFSLPCDVIIGAE